MTIKTHSKITPRRITKKGKLNENTEYGITILKASGETQYRHIACTEKKMKVMLETDKYHTVYDVEKGRLSRFNLTTSVVPPVQLN